MKVKQLEKEMIQAIKYGKKELFEFGERSRFEHLVEILEDGEASAFEEICENYSKDKWCEGIKFKGNTLELVREERFGDDFDGYEWVYKWGDSYFMWTGSYHSDWGTEKYDGPVDCVPVEIVITEYREVK